MAVKTDYQNELKALIIKMYSPSTLEDKTAAHLTLSNIWQQITNILPEQWVDESDVWQCLNDLNFRPYNINSEQLVHKKKKEKLINKFGLYYIVKMN